MQRDAEICKDGQTPRGRERIDVKNTSPVAYRGTTTAHFKKYCTIETSARTTAIYDQPVSSQYNGKLHYYRTRSTIQYYNSIVKQNSFIQ